MKTEIIDDYKEGENQSTVAYVVEFANKVNNISVQGEGIKAIIDNAGVKYSSIEWNDYEKVSQKGRAIARKIGFEEATKILEKELSANSETRSLLLDSESNDNSTVINTELVFAYEDECDSYIPVWRYEMEDGKIYNIKCATGEINEL